MKNQRYVILALLITTISACCKKEVQCPGLTDDARSYIPYNPNQIVKFANYNDTILFKFSNDFFDTEPMFWPEDCKLVSKSHSECMVSRTITAQTNHAVYKDLTLSSSILERRAALGGNTFQNFMIGMSVLNTSFVIRDRKPDFDPSRREFKNVVFYPEISLNNRKFNDVYCNSSNPQVYGSFVNRIHSIYFNMKGVVGFSFATDSTVVYTLVN
ncbi:MAG: hypothetical protein ACK4K9_00880 [Bacteroidia bacterium]